MYCVFFFFKQKTAYDMRISDWSSDVCSSDLFEGIPSITERQSALYRRYRDTLAARTPDFQTSKGYPTAPAGRANLSMSTNQLAERFGAVAMTLEMPFKDNDEIGRAHV